MDIIEEFNKVQEKTMVMIKDAIKMDMPEYIEKIIEIRNKQEQALLEVAEAKIDVALDSAPDEVEQAKINREIIVLMSH